MVRVRIKRLNENAVIPAYAKSGDAGMDLVATSMEEVSPTQVKFGTGLAMEIPYGYVGLIFPRSSIFKAGLSLSNAVGVIDSGYRGEIMAVFNKKFPGSQTTYKVGDRIAQIMIIPYPKVMFAESEDISESERGTGGFGSTGL